MVYKKFIKPAILIKNHEGYYSTGYRGVIDGTICAIESFLTDEIGDSSDVQQWTNDIMGPNGTMIYCGMMFEVRRNGDLIHLADAILPDGVICFTTTRENFIKIISDWVAIKKDPRYNVIIIWRDGDKPWKDGDQIIFEGRLEEHPYKKYLKGEKVTKI